MGSVFTHVYPCLLTGSSVYQCEKWEGRSPRGPVILAVSSHWGAARPLQTPPLAQPSGPSSFSKTLAFPSFHKMAPTQKALSKVLALVRETPAESTLEQVIGRV